ncbi:MAG: urease accessory protein UreD [Rubrivivax sp.]|nr:urease accessory protein UreD [Rubrivivax sp.]
MAVPAAAAPARPGWAARLALRVWRDGPATRVHAAHEGPLRLLKALHPEGPGIAHAVLLHPPGGLVGGDRLDVELQVEAGAHLLVTTPAASRFYRSVAGEAAQVMQAKVAEGARLEWLPQETLAYDGCDARNAWQVQLSPRASLMATEVLALGLGAAGRPFAQGRFVQQLAIEGLWRERGVIDAADAALLDGPCGLAGRHVLGTLLLAAAEALSPQVAEHALAAARQAIDAATSTLPGERSAQVHGGVPGSEPMLAGATLLQGRLLLLRALAHDVQPLARLLRDVRGHWRRAVWGLGANEPRLWAL